MSYVEVRSGLAEDPVERHEQEAAEAPANAAVKFPEALKRLFIPKRYKILRGGRGGAKSWGIARALLAQGAARKLRIGCFREIQKSLKESVHQLLKDQIEGMGLGDFYEVLETEIRGRNGTLFVFAGLSSLTATSIKSFEGLDIAWVEEAQTVTRRSWGILIPTIRKNGSEIWLSMNPELDTDDTWQMFVEDYDSDAMFDLEVNWRDNPWFPEVLNAERLRAKRTMKADEYNNVWEGKTRSAVEGAIYADEIAEMMSQGRITMLPYEPRLRTHVVLDLGWNDSMFIALVQRQISEIRVIKAIEVDHVTLNWVNTELRRHPFNWGKLWLPHDGAHGDYKTGKSARTMMKEMGWDTAMVPNVPLETGIKRGRLALERTYMDKRNCQPLINSLRRYKRAINKHDEGTSPIHDASSHGADCWRYVSLCAERMTNYDDSANVGNNRAASYGTDDETGM